MKLKNTICISILLTCISLQAYAEINLNEFRLTKRSGSYANFSRDNLLRYRGVGPELTPHKAIKAMLGDESSSMNTMLTDGIKLKLMKKSIPFEAYITGYFDARLLNTINSKLSANNDAPYSEYDASLIAVEISENHFSSKYTNNDILNRFIDYSSPYYLDYPNDPREVIFTTAYMEVAANYSSHVAVINETVEKSIDLNFFNYVKNGIWIRKIKPWPDRGEFVTAISIPASDITGYEIRKNFVKDFETFAVPGNNLKIAFYKINHNQQDYVLIIDGNNMEGIFKNGNTFNYAVSNINPNMDVPQNLLDSSVRAEVLGIISLCPINDTCKAPKNLIERYNIDKNSSISRYYLNQIKQIRFNNLQAKVFNQEKDIPAADYITEDKVISTPVVISTSSNDLGNLQNLGAADLQNDKYLNILSYQDKVTSTTNNSIEYSLASEHIFSAGDSIYFLIPNEYQALEIDNIEITHRKVNDADYATMSVQVYSAHSKEWHTSGNLGRKGKLNSPAISDINSTVPDVITGWESAKHKSFSRGSQQNFVLNAQAVRVMSIGRKNNYFQKIKIHFKGSIL